MAQSIATVVSHSAPLYAAPSATAEVVGQMKQGKRVHLTGQTQNRFMRVKTRSGQPIWMAESDLSLAEKPSDRQQPQAQDDVVLDELERRKGADPARPLKRFSFDLGFTTGSANGESYTEVHAGLNYHFHRYALWRNALFGRFTPEQDDFYGLDTSIRATLDLGSNLASFHLFGGPGYRFVTEAKSLPFAEAGAVAQLAGFSLGGAVKWLFGSIIDDQLTDQTQYTLILSGGIGF